MAGKCPGSGNPCTTSIGQHSHQIAIQPSQSIQANDGVTSFEPVQESFRLSHPFLPGPTLKHIPKGARQTCANRLIVLIRNVIENPEEEDAWMTLLQFGPDVLLKPARGGKRHNLTNTIKSRCADNKTGHVMSNIETTSRRNRNPEATLAAAVSSKIEDGNLKAAIRLLCSEETVAPFDSDTHAQLRAKHPPSSLHPSQIEPPDGFPSLILIGEAVADAIRSFPAGSSGGPDGLKPIHLSDTMACQEVKHELIAVVTEFLNLLMDGICPHPSDVGKARHLFVIRYSLLGIPWWLYTQNIQLINHFDFFSWNVYRRGYSSILNQKKIYIMIAKSGNDDGVGAYHADTIAQ